MPVLGAARPRPPAAAGPPGQRRARQDPAADARSTPGPTTAGSRCIADGGRRRRPHHRRRRAARPDRLDRSDDREGDDNDDRQRRGRTRPRATPRCSSWRCSTTTTSRRGDAVDMTDELLDAHHRVLARLARAVDATPAAGARWCTARPSPSSCSPTSRPEPIIAAPTTSLPEPLAAAATGTTATSGSATPAFSLYALLRLGFTDEARAFIGWLSERLGDERRRRPASSARCGCSTTSTATRPIEEIELDHLRGYRDSTPVRVGNAAVDQLQLDIYGELIDSVYLFNKYGAGISTTRGRTSSRSSNGCWRTGTATTPGMWEVRGDDRAVHHLAADVLGGHRAHHPHRPAARPARRPRRLVEGRATRSTSAS